MRWGGGTPSGHRAVNARRTVEFVALFTGPLGINLTFHSSASRQAEREWIVPPVAVALEL
eukprot:3913961-Amphidinium_carterae.1